MTDDFDDSEEQDPANSSIPREYFSSLLGSSAPPTSSASLTELLRENDELRVQLAEAQETLRAIREGEVDAIVVAGNQGDRIFTLEGAESIYRLIVETIKEAAFTLSFDGTILFANAQFGEYLQRPLVEILGHNLGEFAASDQIEIFNSFLIAGRREPVKRRLVFLSADKEPVPAYISSSLLSQPDSESICVVATDLTELENSTHLIQELRRQTEALRASEERFRSVIDNSSDTIYRFNLQSGRYEYFSPSAVTVYGFSSQEMTEMTEAQMLARIHPEDRAGTVELLSRMLTSGSAAIAFRWRDRDGAYRWLSACSTIVRDGEGLPLYRDGIVRDITSGKRAEEDLRSSAARLQLLSSTASRLLASENPQHIVNELCQEVMAHLDCQAFFNFLADDTIGKLHLNACAGISEAEALQIEWLDYGVAVCGCAAQAGCRIIAEDILHVQDSRTALVRSYGIQAYCCHPLIAQGRVIGTLSFGTKTRPHFTHEEIDLMRTIADQVAIAMQRLMYTRKLCEVNESLEQRVIERTAEVRQQADRLHALAAELSQAEQKERKRLATILHDHIQQLLVAAQIQLSYIAHKDGGAIGAALQSVEAIIRETIDASRSLAMDLSPPILHLGGLAVALNWLADRMEERSLFKVHVQADCGADAVAEPMRLLLFECCRELILNAVKHSGVREASVRLELTPDEWIRIVVEDSGTGFNSEDSVSHSRGLGLFGIQQRITYVGGKFEIESAPGRGTRVTLLAPPSVESSESAASSLVSAQGIAALKLDEPAWTEKRIRVLLVDDHRIVRQGLSSLLKLESRLEIVAEAEDGEQALRMAHQYKPDVVVTDVSMPGMDGVELTRRLIRELPGIQVLGLSMHLDKSLAAAMRDAGACGYLTKGGLSEDLIAAIHQCGTKR